MRNDNKASRKARQVAKGPAQSSSAGPSVRNAKLEPVAAMTQRPREDTWNLRLYVAGDSPKSRTAIANLERLCQTHLAGRYRIEVVDLKTRPDLAKVDQILALPTLIRKIPEPVKRIIGDLSNAERTLVGLDMHGSLNATPRGAVARSGP